MKTRKERTDRNRPQQKMKNTPVFTKGAILNSKTAGIFLLTKNNENQRKENCLMNRRKERCAEMLDGLLVVLLFL
mgnify:CR=1 FL=1